MIIEAIAIISCTRPSLALTAVRAHAESEAGILDLAVRPTDENVVHPDARRRIILPLEADFRVFATVAELGDPPADQIVAVGPTSRNHYRHGCEILVLLTRRLLLIPDPALVERWTMVEAEIEAVSQDDRLERLADGEREDLARLEPFRTGRGEIQEDFHDTGFERLGDNRLAPSGSGAILECRSLAPVALSRSGP